MPGNENRTVCTWLKLLLGIRCYTSLFSHCLRPWVSLVTYDTARIFVSRVSRAIHNFSRLLSFTLQATFHRTSTNFTLMNDIYEHDTSKNFALRWIILMSKGKNPDAFCGRFLMLFLRYHFPPCSTDWFSRLSQFVLYVCSLISIRKNASRSQFLPLSSFFAITYLLSGISIFSCNNI